MAVPHRDAVLPEVTWLQPIPDSRVVSMERGALVERYVDAFERYDIDMLARCCATTPP